MYCIHLKRQRKSLNDLNSVFGAINDKSHLNVDNPEGKKSLGESGERGAPKTGYKCVYFK